MLTAIHDKSFEENYINYMITKHFKKYFYKVGNRYYIRNEYIKFYKNDSVFLFSIPMYVINYKYSSNSKYPFEINAKYLKLLYDVSCFAKKDNPRHRLQFSVNGLSLAIIAYLKLKKDSIIEQVCTYSVSECIEKINYNINVIKTMGVKENDIFFAWLINRKNTLQTYYNEHNEIEKRGNNE